MRIACFFLLLLGSHPLFAQVEEAKSAIEQKEYVRAVNILSAELAQNPSADVYLYLGIAYTRMREWEKAENTFKEGAKRFPADPRFYNELADVYLTNNDSASAKEALRAGLAANADNGQTSDRLATIEMSEGNIRSALHYWNQTGRPILNDVLENSHSTFEHPIIKSAMSLQPGSVLRYAEWRTTHARLMETRIFTRVDVDFEPTSVPDRYNANIMTSAKTNSPETFAFDIIKGAPFQTAFANLWDIRNSGISLTSSYRWDANRRRAEVNMIAPIPLSGILFLEAGGLWRNELWNLSSQLNVNLGSLSRFRYKSTGAQVGLKIIPHYRFEIGTGFEYTNRAVSGELPQLLTNSQNVGKILFQTSLRINDRARYQNRLFAEGYVARQGFIGDLNYREGTAELDNHLSLSSGRHASALNWTIKGGVSGGILPVEDYFMLGMDQFPLNILRGHKIVKDGQYGNGPMATDFVLANSEFERRFGVLPLFNALNLPYILVKGTAFLDLARTWDRAGIFKEYPLLVDTGVGLKLETTTHSLNLTYGRALRSGDGVFSAWVQKKW
jgi:outer membrane protein assembly factor BamA